MRKLLRFSSLMFLLIVSTAASAWKFTSVSPAEGKVTELYQISLFEPAGTMWVDEMGAMPCSLVDANDNVVATYNMSDNFQKQVAGTPTNYATIKDDGTYTLTIPAGTFHIDGVANEEQSFTWTIGNAAPEPTPGQDKENAIELTVGTAKAYSATEVTESGTTTYICWFYYTAEKDGTATFNATNSNAKNIECDGVGTIAQGKMNVVAGETYYIKYICYNNNPSFASVEFQEPAPQVVELTINEDDDEALTKIRENYGKTVNFKSDRKLYAEKWNTLVLPFDVAISDFAKVLRIQSIIGESDVFTVTFTEYTSFDDNIWASTPVLVKAKTENDGKAISYDGVVIPEDCAEEDLVESNIPFCMGYAIVGSYAPVALTPGDGAYYISNNMFYYADESSDVTMNGFRAYIQVPAGMSYNVRSFAIDDNIIETAVEEMQATGAKTATVTFDLSGKKVAVKKGIVIENGQKVMY